LITGQNLVVLCHTMETYVVSSKNLGMCAGIVKFRIGSPKRLGTNKIVPMRKSYRKHCLRGDAFGFQFTDRTTRSGTAGIKIY